MNHKLESRLPGEISVTSDTNITPPYGRKEGELKSFKKKKKKKKSRDITLLTKVCLLKAMFFPVVMYGYESWTIKKVEH